MGMLLDEVVSIKFAAQNLMGPDIAAAQRDLVAFKTEASVAAAKAGEFGAASQVAGTRISGMNAAMASSQTSTSAISKNLSGLGLAFGGVAVAAGAYAIHIAAAFDQASAHVLAGTSVTKAQLGQVKTQVIDLSTQTGQSATSIMSAFYNIASSISSTAAARKILTEATRFGAAFDTDATTATSLLSGVYNAYHMKIKDIPAAQDALTQAVRLGAAEARDLAPAYANVIPLAAHMGISLQTLGAMFAQSTNAGISAAETGVRIGNMLEQLNAPTAQQIKAVHALGGSYADLHVHHGNVIGTLERLNQLMHVATPSVQQISDATGLSASKAKIWADELSNADGRARMLFGGSQTAALEFFNVMNDGGAQQHQLLKQMADDAGTTEASFKTAMDNSQADFNKAKASAQALAIEVGGPLAKAASALLQQYIPAAQQVSKANHDSGMSFGFLGDAILKVVDVNNAEFAWWATMPSHVKALGDALGVTSQKANITAMTTHGYAAEIAFLKEHYDQLAPPMKSHLTVLEREYSQFRLTTQAAKEKAAALQKTADAYGHLMTKMGGVDGRGIILGQSNAPGSTGGTGSGSFGSSAAAPYYLDLQKQIKDVTGQVQSWANIVAQDTKTHSASLAADTAQLNARKATLEGLQKQESDLTSTTKKTASSIDEWTRKYGDAQAAVTSAQHRVGLDLLDHSSHLKSDEAWLGKVTAQLGLMDGALSKVTGKALSYSEQLAAEQQKFQTAYDNAVAKLALDTEHHKSKAAIEADTKARDVAKVSLDSFTKNVDHASQRLQKLPGTTTVDGVTSAPVIQVYPAVSQTNTQVDPRQQQYGSLAAPASVAQAGGAVATPAQNKAVMDALTLSGQISAAQKTYNTDLELVGRKLYDLRNHIADDLPPLSQLEKNARTAKEALDGLQQAATDAANAVKPKPQDHPYTSTYNPSVDSVGMPAHGLVNALAASVSADDFLGNFSKATQEATDAFRAGTIDVTTYNGYLSQIATDTENYDVALGNLTGAADVAKQAYLDGNGSIDTYVSLQKQANTQTDAHNQKMIQADIKLGDFTGAAALAKTAYENGTMSLQDYVPILQHANAATRERTAQDWNAAYAAASVAERLSMLSQKFAPLISQQSTIQGAQSAVNSAQDGVLSAQSAVEIGELQAITTGIQDLAGIMMANTAVGTAQFNLQLSAINDGAALKGAIFTASLDQIKQLDGIKQDVAKGDTVKEGLDRQLLAAQNRVGADNVAIARAKMQADQAVGQAQLRVAELQQAMAADKYRIDQANARAAHTIALDKLKVAQDAVAIALDSQKITLKQLGTLQTVASILSDMGGGFASGDISKYGTDLQSLGDQLGADQTTQGNDNTQLTKDTNAADLLSANGAQTLAQDQSGIDAATSFVTQTQQSGELNIAGLQAGMAGDSQEVQLLQQAVSSLSTIASTATQQLAVNQSQLDSALELISVMSRTGDWSNSPGGSLAGMLDHLGIGAGQLAVQSLSVK
jgi:TP901 family phage tail tape measure protein